MCESPKQRKNFFPKSFKRKVLIELSKGRKPLDILEEFEVKKGLDKKYAVKLLHKWRREFYKNTKIMALTFLNIDKNYASKEINSICQNLEEQGFLEEFF